MDQRGGAGYEFANIDHVNFRTRFATLGSNQALTPRLTNEVRYNFSRSSSHAFLTLDNFDGAVAPANTFFYPSFTSPEKQTFVFYADTTANGISFSPGNWQRTGLTRST